VRTKYGVAPAFIPDYLALIGDSADGYPGIPGCGPKTAATLINRYGHLEQFPREALDHDREPALLFKTLATLRTDAPLFDDVEELRWRGPMAAFAGVAQKVDPRLSQRVRDLEQRLARKGA
jgi:5'-3' exonuclease